MSDPRGPFRDDDEPHDADAEAVAFAASYAMTTVEAHFPGNLEPKQRERIQDRLADMLLEAYDEQRMEHA